VLEQAILRERFEELLEMQRRAMAGYAELTAKSSDPAVREDLDHLRREKLRHVQLTERLLEIVE